jgi:hypothetical protein
MISNLCLFAYAIAKALLLTGLGPGLVAGFLWSRVRVIEIGFEKVRGGQLARQNDRTFNTSESWATSPPRKVRVA